MTDRSIWWGSFLQRQGLARGDLAGGLTAALVLPAIEGSYGLVAFAPLGADHASFGFLLGAWTAAVASFVSVMAGGRGPLLSGSSAALALLLGSLFGWLVTDSRFLGADGRPFMPTLMAFAALGVVLAGVMQALVAKLKLAGLVRFVPYPVHAGYMNGTAVLMVAAMWLHLFGMPAGANPLDVDVMEEFVLLNPPLEILEVACGIGRYAVEFAKRGYRVVGMDVEKQFIDQAEKAARDANVKVEFGLQSASELTEENHFDFVLSHWHVIGFMAHEEIKRHFVAIQAALKPGCSFLYVFQGPRMVPSRKGETTKPVRNWTEKGGKFILTERSMQDGVPEEYSVGKFILTERSLKKLKGPGSN